MYLTVLTGTGMGLTSKMSTVGWPTLVIKVHVRGIASFVHAVVLHADVSEVLKYFMRFPTRTVGGLTVSTQQN